MAETYTPAQMAAAILSIPGGGGEMPTGAVMHYAGLSAPDGWLECDGTVYNIADYPALAAFFETNYGANNYWGGDGTATFGVPDWRGEFLRGAGANAHTEQGSGAIVGEHQDGTAFPGIYTYIDNARIYGAAVSGDNSITNGDYVKSGTNISLVGVSGQISGPGNLRNLWYTSRPTNTSLLVCIKT